MNNTPTKRVENFLDSYTSGNDTVLKQLKEMVDSDAMMNDNQRTTYSDIMKRQYKDMTYEIKNEEINDNEATVTAELKVTDEPESFTSPVRFNAVVLKLIVFKAVMSPAIFTFAFPF